MKKTIIAGVPRAGKTTLADELSKDVKHTDDLATLAWSEQSDKAQHWINTSEVMEGTTVPRALRKWLANNPTGKPCDQIYWLDKEKVPLTLGQQRMAAGCRTVWNEIKPELIKRGVEIL